ncbi:Histidine phosphatase superfamily, clade-2 [Penicillium expansum]|uniref:Histidine phosphatase superfamily, clade-2 n=1 Tax=Penicillium expansum TaxID=27334 RepID=A0A0A2KJC8_PENEN|nr:Histidine phosphatase superfamily, clade-2 [Penicillium expansum]KGO48221.1 Histidine phosphatase superfamily, clade-2 [Penicillium expansum]KGO61300.1 Histidine phosphatase superfamily, clade-2 [Penicillium expansum]KGO67889.1 Histidine phosphatase superfamily, clade-2 [Penicillium expansum]
MASLHSSAIALLALAVSTAAIASSSAAAAGPTGLSYPSGFDMKTSWANLSPYTDASGFNVSKGFPLECELSQVHVLHRHAQRYPTQWPLDGEGMENFAQKLINYTKKYPNKKIGSGSLAFLDDWEYMLGLNTLLPTGAATEATSGAQFWSQYGRLLYRAKNGDAAWDASLNVYPNGTARPKPTFRTTSYPRILESARWWLSGFFGNTGGNSSYSEYNLTIIPEVEDFNNTLSSTESCPNGMEPGDNAAQVFALSFVKDARKRLAAHLPKDFKLDTVDILAMLNMCPYEYATLGRSSFCALFTEQEWRDFEYYIDLQFYGDYGFGSPSGRAQGIGYVQELAARLQSKLIPSSDSSINYTYDDNTKTFPLDQPLYMDMSHDDIIVSVLAALGLDYFKYGPHGLPVSVTHAPPRTFNLNQMTPFGARLFSEVWTCPKDVSFKYLQVQKYKNPDLSSKSDTTDYIRFVLNNAPVPLDGLKVCDGSVNGFCKVGKFLSAIPDLNKEAMYQEACYGDYNITSQVGNGQPRKP